MVKGAAELRRRDHLRRKAEIEAASLDIKKSVNPELLGGFVIKIDDKVFDTSLHNKLSAMRREFLAG